ncbi:hypothetical protein BST26_12865 [Mycolicibacterium insubricum]|uniref:Helix-turn-helix domain-containing protein n=1 Tax=Mycolicibacterium insubricum TaxID=444597 RepID=A0A1X0DBH5_9MYCO|nr:hypothetical protein BST26_12865 [Mycolicibacterium insubricum]
MDAVRQATDIPADQRLVIMDIGATADQNGNDAWRDNATISKRLSVTTRTVTRARAAAVAHGLLWVTRDADRRHSARYRLVMPEIRGDSTVTPSDSGVTIETGRGDSRDRQGRQCRPLGVTPLSTAMGSSMGISSDASSGTWLREPGTSPDVTTPDATDQKNQGQDDAATYAAIDQFKEMLRSEAPPDSEPYPADGYDNDYYQDFSSWEAYDDEG